jgi:NAD(P)-dependent dehydrogenase (short-subunit alcohol dehydrogenase family)
VRPLDEQTILITGSTDGLGEATAEKFARCGADMLVHGRSEQKLERALAKMGADRGARVRGLLADLSSLEQTRRLARDVEKRVDRLDTLVNNAGVVVMGGRLESRDGFELTFAVNYLSHFALTAELMPLLRRSTPSRVINVASLGQSPVNFEDPMAERDYEGFRAYAQSKLAQIMFTMELADRLRAVGEEGVTVNALHPATFMDTKMLREGLGRAGRSEVAEGVVALSRLVEDPALDGVSGRYFDQLEEGTADAQAYDADARRRLWELSEELTGERFDL